MTWAPTETQKAIYDLLVADSSLQTLLSGTPEDPKIYDSVPDKKAYPYVTMQIKPMDNRDNESWDGVGINYQINVWYQGPGQGDLKVQQIQARIDQLLNKQDICIDGWNVTAHNRVTVDILDEPDNRTKHGVQIFKLFLGEA